MADMRSSWSVTASTDNGAAAPSKAAVAGASHYVSTIHASFSAALIKALTLTDGSTTVGVFYVHNGGLITFPEPGLKITTGAAVTASLAASGAGGTIGTVTMTGYTGA